MKIVVTGTRGIPNIMGGVETHCEELFPRIVKKGFDVTLIRRKSYVKDSISEYKGVKLIDIETPKKNHSKLSFIHSELYGRPNQLEQISYTSMLLVLPYLHLWLDFWE